MQDFIQLFTFTSIGFGLMLALKLLTVKKHGLIVMWLGFYVLLLVGSLCEVFLKESHVFLSMIGMTYWLFGPCLYLYVHDRVSEHQLRFFKDCAIHLMAFFIYVVAFLITQGAGIAIDNELIDFVLYETVFAHILIYFVMAIKLLKKFNRISSPKNSTERMQRASMIFLVVASLAIFGSSWLSTHIMIFAGSGISDTYRLLVQVVFTLLIFAIALLNTETRYTERMKVF